MALSDTVKESLRDAQEDLRNALAAAARTEKPFVSKHIADMLAMIDTIIDASEMLEKLENIGLFTEDELVAKGYQLTDTGWVKA